MPLHDDAGNVIGILGTYEDITERLKEEQEVKEREELLRIVLDTIPQAVFWKDKNLTYLGCNQNFANDAGVEGPEAIIGKTDFDFSWTDEEAEFFRSVDQRVMDSDTPELNIVEPQLQADGKQAWLMTNKAPLHDTSGNVIGILGTYEDITERLQAEQELKEREEEFRTLYVDAPVAYISLAVDGTIEQANQRSAEILQIKLEKLVGRSMDDFYAQTASGVEKAQQLQKRLLAGEDVLDEELEIVTAKGRTIWLSLSIHPILDEKGALQSLRSAARDITRAETSRDGPY